MVPKAAELPRILHGARRTKDPRPVRRPLDLQHGALFEGVRAWNSFLLAHPENREAAHLEAWAPHN
jgi:hypothetical protein